MKRSLRPRHRVVIAKVCRTVFPCYDLRFARFREPCFRKREPTFEVFGFCQRKYWSSPCSRQTSPKPLRSTVTACHATRTSTSDRRDETSMRNEFMRGRSHQMSRLTSTAGVEALPGLKSGSPSTTYGFLRTLSRRKDTTMWSTTRVGVREWGTGWGRTVKRQ